MFKLVVLCAFIAAAGAEPSAIIAPLGYSATLVAPATTTISRQASSVVHPSPLLYSAPLGYAHFIKKRSAPLALSSYITPTTYITGAPLTTTYSAPLIHAAPIVPAAPLASVYATHFIKKRSAPLAYTSAYSVPTTYISAAPLATTYSAPLIHSTRIVSAAPLASVYSTHFIKKRSAPLAYQSTYLAPTTYISGAPLATTYSASLVRAPIVAAAPLTPVYTHLIKKRSAPITYITPTSYSSQSRIDIQGTPVVTSYASYPVPLAYSTQHVL